jgi:hypothetical protein
LIARLFRDDEAAAQPETDLKPTWNMAPTMNAPLVRRLNRSKTAGS